MACFEGYNLLYLSPDTHAAPFPSHSKYQTARGVCCATVSWHGGGSSDGLEYALVSPVKDTTTAAAPRLFKDAEAYCSRLGGGAHLGSIQTEDEKNRINQAFTAFPFFADLKSVWIGLSNLDPGP